MARPVGQPRNRNRLIPSRLSRSLDVMTERDIARDAVRAAISLGDSLPASVSDRRELMGGWGKITIVGGGQSLLDQAWSFAHRCEALWTRFDASSDVQRLNWSEGVPTEVDPLTIQLIGALKRASVISGGDFDPTLLPSLLEIGYVASLADSRRMTTLPASARAPGNLAGVETRDNLVTMPVGTTIDAGGMGKGLAADLVCAHALDDGALGIMAEFLGDIVVAGAAPDGQAWRLAVEDPFDTEKQVDLVRISHGAIVTSSQLKRRLADGSAHHLLNARSGESAASPVQTATVIAGTGAHAEALSKSAFVRETPAYLEWLPTQNAAGMVVLADGTQQTSLNWEAYR
ncbi:MAG: FAD:protein FMN transferase [Actinobacteria bacterium]|nr:FAD:protein FMN transferase [Actinomycetota bacterium]